MNSRQAGELLAFAEAARTNLAGIDGKVVLALLEDRRADLLAALDWYVAHERPGEAFRLAGALVPFWMATMRIDEGATAFERVLAMPGGDAAQRGRALFDHGYLIFWAGRDAESGARFERARGIGRSMSMPEGVAFALGAGHTTAAPT